MAWLCGRGDEAFSWWQRAFESASALDARPELGRILGEAGRAMQGGDRGRRLGGRDADACLEEAGSIFRELSLEADLARIASR